MVALEPKTGKILAMVSKPDYDPNSIAEIWESVVTDSSKQCIAEPCDTGIIPAGNDI